LAGVEFIDENGGGPGVNPAADAPVRPMAGNGVSLNDYNLWPIVRTPVLQVFRI
jgi:hypothetical protein